MSPAWWSVTRLRDACPRCATTFEPARGEWTGALMFGQGFYFSVALLGLFALPLAARATLPILLAWLALSTVAFPLLTYRHFKAAWIGVMWAAKPW